LSAVAHQVRAWHRRACTIPDAPIREDALGSLGSKRGHTDGAALFWVLPRRRNTHLLCLLVAYEIMWDFLDSTNERGAERGTRNGCQLHLALIEGLDPEAPISSYYRYHPWSEDGGYLRKLVEVCRTNCLLLPSYRRVAPLTIREAVRAQVLGLNHDPSPASRDAGLRRWAADDRPAGHGATWYEWTGAASASLTVHVLLALAAEPTCCEIEITAAHAAYFPWISAATTMLDSYVDQAEDAVAENHSYIAHYPDRATAVQRVGELIRFSAQSARALPKGTRHAVIVACMVAMYLSKDSARVPEMRADTHRLVCAGGSLARLLVPVLRLWRIVYGQRSA
jgi:tetraprenyl-beta-curcumene synthase